MASSILSVNLNNCFHHAGTKSLNSYSNSMTLKNVWHRYHPAQSKRSKLEVRGFAAEEKTIYSWRTLGCAAVVYVIIFTIDVTIGGTFIVWKCHFRYDADECRLAGGGTLGSVLIWCTVLFVLPNCVTKIDRDDIRNACRRCVHKVRPPVSREIQREHPV